MSGQKIIDGLQAAVVTVTHGGGNIWRDLDIVLSRAQWEKLNADAGTNYPYPFADVIEFPAHLSNQGEKE